MVLRVIVVISVVLVSMRVFRGHMMESWILVMMRSILVTFVVLVSLRVVTLEEPSLGLLGMLTARMASLVRLLSLVEVMFITTVSLHGSMVLNCLVVL